MAEGQLTARAVDAAKHPGSPERPIRIADANGLYLQITPAQAKSWLLRCTLNGKTREMGLGTVGKAPSGPNLTLATGASGNLAH